MDDQEKILALLNARTPDFFTMLGGEIVAFEPNEQTCTITFDISRDFCHSVDVVQGGFITVMLDSAMSHAAFTSVADIGGVSSLEIKTSYLEPTRAGQLRAVGRVVKSSYKTAFLEGQLYNADGLLTATSSSVAKLVRNT